MKPLMSADEHRLTAKTLSCKKRGGYRERIPEFYFICVDLRSSAVALPWF
jgi:hypothetical protein